MNNIIMAELNSEQKQYIEHWSPEVALGTIIWTIGHKQWLYTLLLLVPGVNFFLWLFLIFKGRKKVWESGRYLIFEAFKDREDKLRIVVITIVIILILLGILEAVVDF